MTTATITNLNAAGAMFELAGMEHWFPSWRDAVDEAERRGMEYVLIHPSDSPAVVLAKSPALTS
jgi:hypothetical protein